MAAVPEKYYTALQQAGVSVEEATRYYASFKIYDKDGSDTVDAGELFSCLQVLGQTPKSKDEVDKLMKEHDKDSSGSLDFLEFAKLMSHVCKPMHAVRDDLVLSFQVFDKDHSGYLDRQELHDAIYSMGHVTLTEKEFDQLVKAADTNGDGKIDYAEFTALLLTDISSMIQSSKKKLDEKKSHGDQDKAGHHDGKDKDQHGEKGKDHHGDKENDHHGDKGKDHHGDKEKDHHGDKEKDHHGDKDKDHHGDKDKDHHGDKGKDHHGDSGKQKKRKRSGSGGSGRSHSRGSVFSVESGKLKFNVGSGKIKFKL